MNYKKMLSLLLAVVMVFGTGIASFSTDVAANNWAKANIDRMVEKGIMPTYTDGSFKPNDNVSSVETLIIIYRSIKAAKLVNDNEIDALVAKYEAQLIALGLPKMLAPYGSDVYPALSYALEKKIVEMDEVKTFIAAGQLTTVRKVNASVFFAKALNQFKADNLNKIIVLTYNDEAMITLSARKYIYFLIENSILSSKGDTAGNFNPNSTLNRMVVAVMIDNFTTVVSKMTPVEVAPIETPKEEVKKEDVKETIPPLIVTERTVKGTVESVEDVYQTVVLTEDKTAYDLSHAVIFANEQQVGIEALAPGVAVELAIEKNYVTKVIVTPNYTVIKGQLNSISDWIGTTDPFKSTRISLANKTVDAKRAYAKTLVMLNGTKATLADLKPNTAITLYNVGSEIVRIQAYSDTFTSKAQLLTKIDTKAPAGVKLLLASGVVYETAILPEVVFVGGASGFEVNTLVNVTFKNGSITKVENIGKIETYSGKISEIYIKKSPEVTLVKGESLALAKNVVIINESGASNLTVYDLRLDQDVTLYTGINGVSKIEFGQKAVVVEGAVYKVTQLFTSTNLMIAMDEKSKPITIVMASTNTQKVDQFTVGDTIALEGKFLTEGIFEATKVIKK